MSRTETGPRDRLVDASLALLRRGGMAASGVNNVVAEARAPKGSLYHYFPGGKDQLVEEALQKYRAAISAALRSSLHSDHPLARRVKTIFRGLAAEMARDGFASSCAVGAVVLELGADDVALNRACRDALAEWIDVVAGGLPELPAKSRRQAAEFFVTLLEGAQTAARAKREPGPLYNAEECFIAFAKGFVALGLSTSL